MPALRNEIFSLPVEFLMKSVRGTTKQNTKAKDNGQKKGQKRRWGEERRGCGAWRGRLAEEVPPFKFIYLRVWTLCPWRSTVPLPLPALTPSPPESTVMRRDATVVNAKCVPCPVSTTWIAAPVRFLPQKMRVSSTFFEDGKGGRCKGPRVSSHCGSGTLEIGNYEASGAEYAEASQVEVSNQIVRGILQKNPKIFCDSFLRLLSYEFVQLQTLPIPFLEYKKIQLGRVCRIPSSSSSPLPTPCSSSSLSWSSLMLAIIIVRFVIWFQLKWNEILLP